MSYDMAAVNLTMQPHNSGVEKLYDTTSIKIAMCQLQQLMQDYKYYDHMTLVLHDDMMRLNLELVQ